MPAIMPAERLEIWKSTNGRWYYHRRAANGKLTDPSQGYKWKSSCIRAAKKDCPGPPVVVIFGTVAAD